MLRRLLPSSSPQVAGRSSAEPRIDAAVRAFQEGIRRDESFEILLEAYWAPVGRFLRRRVQSPGDLEDLNQEVFLRVYKGLVGFEWNSSFKGWLFAIAHNVAVQWHAKNAAERRRRAFPAPLLEEDPVAQVADPGPDALEQLIRKSDSAKLRLAIEELPYRMRRCASLRFLKGRSYQEIADDLGISIQTVKPQLFQAKARLLRRLGGNSARALQSEEGALS